MSRPGVEVYSAAAAPPTGVPTDTSVLFYVGEAQMGPVNVPTRLTSLQDFINTFGQRVAGVYSYDALDVYFREGGATAYFQRSADGATAATIAGTAIAAGTTVNAASPGTWGNAATLNVTAVVSALFAAQVTAGTDPEDADSGNGNGNGTSGGGKSKSSPPAPAAPEQSPLLTYEVQAGAASLFLAQVVVAGQTVQTSTATLATLADLTAFLASGDYLTISGGDPTTPLAAGSVTATGGTDGTLPVGASAFQASLDAIAPEVGPGQIIASGRSDLPSHAALLAHASTHNRVALLDGAVTDDDQALISAAASLRGADQDRYGALWGPWATVPGLAPGTSRTVPWSCVQAGLCARNDLAGNPNQAAAGGWGECQYVTALTQTWSAQQMETMLYAGVDSARAVYGSIQAYAFRTLVDPAGPRNQWLELNWARLNMAITAQGEAIGQEYVFSQLDGRGHTIAAFGGELAGMLVGYYDADALFGDDVTDAFVVNVGPAVNPIEQLGQGILAAVLDVKMSPHAELVRIYIVKEAITVSLGG
jgi:hypothetical protein